VLVQTLTRPQRQGNQVDNDDGGLPTQYLGIPKQERGTTLLFLVVAVFGAAMLLRFEAH
jgi:hypothetical protein